jgi:hypothetical protein
MEDQSYFEFGYDERVDRDDEREDQEGNLERVSSRIERAIIRFCKEHPTFHADELRQAVIRDTGIAAPASSDRILRLLRQQGRIDYVVLNRRESLYSVTKIEG